jgi:hypothetical protein
MPGPHPVLLGALSHTEPLEVPNMPTIDEALAIAQEHGLKIIACGEDKAPIHKGWREKASSDPDEIRKMFSDPRAKLVGVPMGKDNDLIAFDIDYREGNTPARNQALEQFGQELLKAHSARIHSTRNGGLHLILLNPTGVRKIPRNIMPKLEVVSEGSRSSGRRKGLATRWWMTCRSTTWSTRPDLPQGAGEDEGDLELRGVDGRRPGAGDHAVGR